jgi:hypothetical protein
MTKTRKPKPLPKLKKNAKPWEILKAVCKVIADEPKRYDQYVTLDRDIESEYYPACGTVGCVAGWTVVLCGRGSPLYATLGAQDILGLTDDEAFDLFREDAAGNKRRFVGGGATPLAHARRGIAHIKRFVKEKWGKTI